MRDGIIVIILGVLALLSPIISLAAAQEDGQEPNVSEASKITDPKWVVIFNFLRSKEAVEPLLNLRVVIHAKTEGDAIVKATFYLNKNFGATLDLDKLAFVEAAPHRPQDYPKESKKEEKK
jgi:hypothetical protein